MTKKQIEAQKKRNDRFNKLPKEKQRVKIAEDVLKAISLRRVKASMGTYFSGPSIGSKAPPKSKELRDVLGEMPRCEVCALGAAFVCAVSQADKLKATSFVKQEYDWDDMVYSISVPADSMREYLEKFFDFDQLVLIENAFEGGTIVNHPDWDLNLKAIKFNERTLKQTKRLQRIMKNIIKNNGTFVP